MSELYAALVSLTISAACLGFVFGVWTMLP